MARKSTARRNVADDGATAAADSYDDLNGAAGTPRGRRPRAGSGGRWWVWVGRAVLWAFIIVVIFNGIWLPFRDGLARPSQEEETPTEEPAFPETAAATFATRFADVYLNASEGGNEQRAKELAAFVPEGEAGAFDLSTDSLKAENVRAVTVSPEDDHNGVVTLTADVNGRPMRLDVPVYAANSTSLVVSGQPALLAAPRKAELPDPPSGETDDTAREELEPRLTEFFTAYAETPDLLSSYLDSGAQVAPLPEGTFEFGELKDVTVPPSTGNGTDVREATATVVWRLPGSSGSDPATLTQNYRVTVTKDGDRWFVRDLQGAPQSFGG